LSGNNANAWISRVLIYSPALSAGDLAAVVAGLQAEATLNGLWPLTYPLVVYHGNSLTLGRGHGATTAAQTYPYQSNALLTNPRGFLFAAYSGQTTAQMSAAHAAGVDAHYKATRSAPQVVVFWEGHNDITAGGLNANQIYAGYQAYGQARKAKGYKVILIDIMNAGDFTAGQQTTQASFNSLLKADFNVASGQTNIYKPANGITYADLLIDIQAEPNLQNVNNATYFSDAPNGVHLTPTGYGVVATYVKNALGLVGVT
jgi:lysophospholipase L1-like esterase